MHVEMCAQPRAVRRVVHSDAKRPPSIDLYEVTPGPHHKLRVVSPALYSVWVHQSARRPLPCYGETDHTCEYHRLPMKQQHYLYVEVPDNPTLRLVRLTSGLVYQVLPELTDPARNWNGVMLELWRQYEQKPDSALLGVIVTEECVESLVRETPDIEWAVERMLTAPDRLKPWIKRRGASLPPPPKKTDDRFYPRTSEARDLYERSIEARKRGNMEDALTFFRLSELANGEAPKQS